jgi:hypothetical protein
MMAAGDREGEERLRPVGRHVRRDEPHGRPEVAARGAASPRSAGTAAVIAARR